MGKIRDVEVQNRTEWFTALYVNKDGQECEIVFTKSRDENIGFEEQELVNVEREGKTVPSDDGIWKEIQEHLDASDEQFGYRSARFTVEVNRDWLDSLDRLVKMVLGNPGMSPEDALEASVFAQLGAQIDKRKVCHV
jgi:hypothetical protein